jgi:hypothetical protein
VTAPHDAEALAAQLQRVREEAVRWCFRNPRKLNLTGSPTNWPNETEDEYAARALAALGKERGNG